MAFKRASGAPLRHSLHIPLDCDWFNSSLRSRSGKLPTAMESQLGHITHRTMASHRVHNRVPLSLSPWSPLAQRDAFAHHRAAGESRLLVQPQTR